MSTLDYLEPLIEAVEGQVFPILGSDQRFTDGHKLMDRFSGAVRRWRKGGETRPIVEDANELAAAAAILGVGNDKVVVRYEPPLMHTPKSFDFGLEWPDGSRSWVDVKTVAPRWDDSESAWQRFLKFSESFPEKSRLIVSKNLSGAAVSGEEFKSRWSFAQRTREVEEKIDLLDVSENGPVRLLFCSNGAFHQDALEDFSDYYRSGQFRADDWSSGVVGRYIVDEGIAFSRKLAGFCFLHRPWDMPLASKFEVDVAGPVWGR